MFSHGRSNCLQGLPFSNGFAFRHSDLDISLTFRDIPTRLQSHSFADLIQSFLKQNVLSEGLDCIKIIEELSDRVKRMVGMRNVVAITSAKVLKAIWHFSNSELSLSQVPIVKLIHQQCQIEADLSLYNVLARENTCLLSLYAGLTSLVLKLTKNVLDV